MSKTTQITAALMEPSDDNWNTCSKAGKMCLNRFFIDEDAAFELSAVYYLKKSPSTGIAYKTPEKFRFDRETK